MKKFFALLLVLSMMMPLVALADEFIMGTNAAFPPFESTNVVDGKNVYEGFDIEIAKLVAAKLGKEFKVEDMAFDGLLLALDSGSVDCVVAAMTIKPERQEQADFSEPYFEAKQLVIVRKDYADIKTLDDIATKTVAVQDATTGYYMAADTLKMPKEKIVAMPNAALAVEELRQGRADCVIVDSAPAKVFASMFDDVQILEGIDTPIENYGIAVKKGNTEVLNACNEVLKEIKADGTYDALVKKFFVDAPAAK